MSKVLQVLLVVASVSAVSFAQGKPAAKPTPAKPPAVVPIKEIVSTGRVSEQTYINEKLKFSIVFPDTWRIRDNSFADEMLKEGFDIRLKVPDDVPAVDKAKVARSLRGVEILVTASRSLPGTADNAIIRVSAEDLKGNPQIKDAVDYFDAVRKMFATMKLPPDFKYSETQAEKLGSHQFAFLDTSSSAGRKRMYATVRSGFAILFTLSYVDDDDLQSLRQILTDAKFRLK